MKPNSFYSSCGVGSSAIQTRHDPGSCLIWDLQDCRTPSPSCGIRPADVKVLPALLSAAGLHVFLPLLVSRKFWKQP